jgi:hypothetical protein
MSILAVHTDPYLILSFDYDNQWLYADWQESQNPQTVQAGCQLILYHLQQAGFCKLLNDNTAVKGTWSAVTEWVNNDFFWQLSMAGVKQLAWIHSANCFSRYTTDYVLQQVNSPLTAAFNDLPAGCIWLQHKQVSTYLRAS